MLPLMRHPSQAQTHVRWVAASWLRIRLLKQHMHEGLHGHHILPDARLACQSASQHAYPAPFQQVHIYCATSTSPNRQVRRATC